MQTTLLIDGMTCTGCTRTVTQALMQIANVYDVQVDLANTLAVITHDADIVALIEAVENAGFDVRQSGQ